MNHPKYHQISSNHCIKSSAQLHRSCQPSSWWPASQHSASVTYQCDAFDFKTSPESVALRFPGNPLDEDIAQSSRVSSLVGEVVVFPSIRSAAKPNISLSLSLSLSLPWSSSLSSCWLRLCHCCCGHCCRCRSCCCWCCCCCCCSSCYRCDMLWLRLLLLLVPCCHKVVVVVLVFANCVLEPPKAFPPCTGRIEPSSVRQGARYFLPLAALPDPLHKLAAKAEETPAATCSFCSERSLITYLRSSCIDASMKNNEWLCAVSKRFNGGQNNRNVVSQGSISWPCNPSSAVLKTCTPWMPMAVSCFSSRSALISAWPCIVLAESFPTSANLETKQPMIWHFLMSKVVTWIMVQGDKLPAPKQALEATVPQCMEQNRRGWCEKPQQWRMPPSLLFSNVSLAIRNS